MGNDIHVSITGNRARVEEAMDAIEGLPGYRSVFIDVDEFDERSERMTVGLSLLNDLSAACEDCDHFDHRKKSPGARCAAGRDCLRADAGCPSRSTQAADEAYGESEGAPAPIPTEKDCPGPRLADALERYKAARFRAHLSLGREGDGEAGSGDDLFAEAERDEKAALDVISRELAGMRPAEREKAVAWLAMNGPEDLAWWRSFLETWRA